ncbi:hypothetical protein [Mesorhizobium sp. WSM1293]
MGRISHVGDGMMRTLL